MARTIELVLAAGVAALLTIVYLVLVGRTLGPAEYADFSAALSVIYFFAVALSPVGPTLARIVAKRVARGEEADVASLRGAIMRRLLIGSVAAAAVLMLAAPLVARWLRFRSSAPVVAAFGCALLFALLSADRGVLQGLMRFRSYNVSVVLEAVIRAAGAVIVLHIFEQSAATALVSYAAAMVLAEVIIAMSWRSSSRMRVDWAEIRQLTGPMFLLMIAAAAFQNVDMLAVKRWFPAEAAGRYGAAVAVARSLAVLFVPLYVLVGPLLTTARERGEPIVRPAVRLALMYVGLSLPALAVLFVWPEQIIRLLFGAEFAGLSSAVVLLAAVTVLLHTSLLLTQVMITVEDFRFLWIYAAVAAAEAIGLMLFHDAITQVLTVAILAQVVLLAAVSMRCAIMARRLQ